eukprot:TRINITY_DN494_c0_g1_i5.p4 TRINITY_DN494_c0_g1~~TRINITY_DN494_c0_g1_i5.p4  ORF type:complete len:125 (-),score=24.55 TRINITY_DN494_c0_g1_i5:178-552(-)
MFDWKKRADENYSVVEGDVWTLTNLRPAPGSQHRKKRKGRGDAAGQGASCGFGMRGQKSRSGRPTRAGFEGGQTPLYRRLPKFVGRPMGPGHTKRSMRSSNCRRSTAPRTTPRWMPTRSAQRAP